MKALTRIFYIFSVVALLTVTLFSVSSHTAYAHEAYVLDHTTFWHSLSEPANLHAIDALKNSHNIKVALSVVGGILALLLINFLFQRSRMGRRVSSFVEHAAPAGPVILRLTIAVTFFFSAYYWSFLGPELPITAMPYAALVRGLLFMASICIGVGLFTEIAAFVALMLFTLGFAVFGAYLITYLNYLGEILVLLLFGSRAWSLDRIAFGRQQRFKKFARYESTIVRVFYGLALAYAAIMVKFLHPELTIKVVNDWNLTQFGWLFPHDPLLVALGAGISELVIGLFIIIGFELRLTLLISLFYITLSLLYFRELVWPHLMLYGIAVSLLIQPETFTLDSLFSHKDPRPKPEHTAYRAPFRR